MTYTRNLEGKTILPLEKGHVEMEYSSVTAQFLAREFISRREGMAFAHCTDQGEAWDDVSDKLRETEMRVCIKRHGVKYCGLVCGGYTEDLEEHLGILLQVYNTSSFVDKPASRKRKA